MKSDLATSVIVAIVGVAVAYFVCNMFIGDIESVTIPIVDDSTSAEVAEPNIELFNYRALNPTVEVYVGDCSSFNEYGECLDDSDNSNDNDDDDDNDINDNPIINPEKE